MDRGGKLAVAALLAVLVLGGLSTVAFLAARGTPRIPRFETMGAESAGFKGAQLLGIEPGGFKEPAARTPTGVKTVVSEEPPNPPMAAERPIEEVLLETGEDPGAVYCMSRVREALVEGNPTFARELLRQFKSAHPNSVLIGEAEALFGTKGRP